MESLEEGRKKMHHRKKPEAGSSSDLLDANVVSSPRAPDTNNMKGHSSKNISAASRSRKKELFRGSFLFFLGVAVIYGLQRTLSFLAFLRIVTLIPVALSLYAGTRSPGRKVEQRILPLVLVLAVMAAQVPAYVSSGLAMVAVMFFSLATIPPQAAAAAAADNPSATAQQQHITTTKTRPPGAPGFLKTALAILLMITVLLTENFLIWVVSATFEPGQSALTAPPPLQDNAERFFKRLLSSLSRPQVVSLRRLWNTQWALVSCLGASFVVVELYHPVRNLYGIATRAVLTVAAARCIRTVSFLLTVIPSQVENCYNQRFPNPPPTDWWDWIWVGIMPRKYGGCNDLIISGHAVITSTIACVVTSVASGAAVDRMFAAALWSMVVLDYSVEIYEGFHYSVDMWLGLVLVTLLWRVMEPLEGPTTMPAGTTASVGPASLQKPKTHAVTVQNVIRYAPPAIIAYIQLVALPQSSSNILILLYVCSVVFIYFKFVLNQRNESKKQFFMHYVQHILLCLLFMAFGIYL